MPPGTDLLLGTLQLVLEAVPPLTDGHAQH